MTEHCYDIVIVGGGFVGASLAIALAKTPLRIALVDAKPLQDSRGQPPPSDIDIRGIALAYSSHLIFQALGLWSQLENAATPIQHIHVSDHGHFGATRFQASQYQVPAFGYVVPAHYLGQVLHQGLAAQTGIHCFIPATVTDLQSINESDEHHSDNIFKFKVTLNQQNAPTTVLKTHLIVAADGSDSVVRKLYQVRSKTIEHNQSAIITTVELARPHGNIAYERFTAAGPVAFLPLGENRCGVVWTVADKKVTELMELSAEHFCQRLQQQFGYRLGRMLQIGKRQVFPLRSVYAEQQIFPGLVLLGNAAHSLHPVGGQGFNLALRDLATLADVLVQAYKNNEMLGELAVLQRYQQRRKTDQAAIIHFSEKVVAIFSNNFSPLVLLRDLALIGIDVLPAIKSRLVQRLMGVAGPAPRLACGLELEDVQ